YFCSTFRCYSERSIGKLLTCIPNASVLLRNQRPIQDNRLGKERNYLCPPCLNNRPTNYTSTHPDTASFYYPCSRPPLWFCRPKWMPPTLRTSSSGQAPAPV